MKTPAIFPDLPFTRNRFGRLLAVLMGILLLPTLVCAEEKPSIGPITTNPPGSNPIESAAKSGTRINLYAAAATPATAQPATPVPPGSSLIANGDFESDRNSDQWPDGWPRPKTGGSWPEENGNHFLRLTSSQPGETVLLYHSVTVPPGVTALELTFRMRVSSLKPGKQPWFDARIMLDFKDATGAKLPGGPAAPNTRKDTDGWVTRSAKFLVPDGARTLDFMPALFQVESGTFDLDDVVLQPTDPAPLREAAIAKAALESKKKSQQAAANQAKSAATLQASGSLIPNGDFESDKKSVGWPDGWGRLKTGGSWEQEAGNHFLRLTATEPGQTIMLYRQIDLPADTKALELTWRQRVSNLKPGKEAWFDARIMLEFKDAAGQKLKGNPPAPYTRGNTDGWVARSARFLVPETAVSLEFMPALFQVERGTFDLDDIVLIPTDTAALTAAATAAAETRRLAYVAPEAPQPAKWPQELHVTGNQVLNRDGQPVWLQGVNVVSLEFLVQGDHLLKSLLVAVDDWKSNLIRLPVKEEYWFGRTGGQKDGGAAYRELVTTAITLVANRGAYVLLDLHRFHAPKQEHAAFWKDAALKFQNHPAVLFDLFNEPHGTSWEVWRDGGFVADKKKSAAEDTFLTAEEKAKAAAGFQSIGMQALVDAVRATGARNIVVTGGLDWAYDLSGIAKGFELKDKSGHGIIYSTHIYPWKRGWQEKVLIVSDKHPILVGEVGADIKKMSFIPTAAQEDPYTWVPDMLGLIQKHKLHWTGFSFHPAATPVMITGWDYTPTPFWGAFAKEALAGKQFELKKMR